MTMSLENKKLNQFVNDDFNFTKTHVIIISQKEKDLLILI